MEKVKIIKKYTLGYGLCQIKFNNGYTVSITNKNGCYCEHNMGLSVFERMEKTMNDFPLSPHSFKKGEDVEIAVLDEKGNFVTGKFTRTEKDNKWVAGWVTPDGLAEIIYKVKNYKNEKKKSK